MPLYFVMEFINGKTLADLVKAHGGLPLAQSVGIALELCSTMQVAIKEGIIHRDIKPENIIIKNAESPDVVMVDFGLSFNEDDNRNLTETEESLDNKFISLPERRGPGENKRDFRSDLTGICAILFYCLTGCSPRNLRDSRGRSPHQWPDYSISNKIQVESQRDALNLFFSRGLNYEIDLRFQTLDELAIRLNEILKPRTDEIVEDLDTVLAREAAALRKNDRKTQLSEYVANIQPINQSYNICFNEISTKLARQKFSLGWQGMATGINEKTSDGDIIGRVVCWVAVQNHPHIIQIHHKFVCHGSECTVYRELLEGPPHQATKTVEATVVVYRYQADLAAPNGAVLIADLKKAITKAITIISHKVQGG